MPGIKVPPSGPRDVKWEESGKVYRLQRNDLHLILSDDGSFVLQQTEDPKGEIIGSDFNTFMTLMHHLWEKTKDEEKGT